MPTIQRKPQKRILLVMLEFMEWSRGRAWGYTGNFAIEEGLKANNIECVIIPVFETPTDSPASWLQYARTTLAGQTFDQVWVWLVHTDYHPTFWEWIDTLAPIKVGWLGESLDYHDAEISEFPILAERKQFVTNQIKHMTHILAVDEFDADYVNQHKLAKAIWVPMAIPVRSVSGSIHYPQQNSAVFYGSVYGERATWLQIDDLKGLISNPQPPENKTELPKMFNQLNAIATNSLAGGFASLQLLDNHVSALRTIRASCFDIWMDELKNWLAVINLPSFGKVYTSRVQETMAAGRPVISWDIPNRPRNRALFEVGTEILLYSKNKPEALADHIRLLQAQPDIGITIASAARDKILKYHTVEKRMKQVLDWIDCGVEPEYNNQNSSPENFYNVNISSTLSNQNAVIVNRGGMISSDTIIFPGSSPNNTLPPLPTMPLTLSVIRERGAEAVNRGDVIEAMSIYRRGVQIFPKELDLWHQVRRLAQLSGDMNTAHRMNSRLNAIQQAKKELNGITKVEDPLFFTQKVAIEIVEDRLDVILQLCTNKKVLHVGCTDKPVFDPTTNLHIRLSTVCSQLDGLDIDEGGIEVLKQFVPARYFTDVSQICDCYDVLLVPETIEHVDNIKEFMQSLSRLEFKSCLITAPNAFLPNDNGNRWEANGEYVEYIHPDHKCWFSPYTLENCIKSFTSWEVKRTYLMNNKSMVGCLCENRHQWYLSKIPKKVHFYWGNDETSFLRFLSVHSFRKLNPDWEINIYLPKEKYTGGIPWQSGEGYDGANFQGKDFSHELFSIKGINVKEVDFSPFPAIAAAPENYKSDFFRWHILGTEGGLYSDIDILYFRPMSEIYFNTQQHANLDMAICLQQHGNIIGFLMSAPDNSFFKNLFNKSIKVFNTATYQAISAPMVNSIYPTRESISTIFPDMELVNMPMSVVYSIDHSEVPHIFQSSDVSRLKSNTIGIHWYAGHPVAQQFNNMLTDENFTQFDSIITRKIKDVFP